MRATNWRCRAAAAAALMIGALLYAEPATADPRCGQVRENGRVDRPANVKVPDSCARPGAKLWIGDLSFEIPRRGAGLEMNDLVVGGGTASEILISNGDGVITIEANSESDSTTGTSSSATALPPPPPCADPAKAWSGNRNNNYEYFVNSSSDRPVNVSTTDFEAEINYAHTNVDQVSNDCGYGGGYALKLNLFRKGATTLRSMNTDGSCAKNGISTIDFGYLPLTASGGQVGARACTQWDIKFFADNVITEADVRLAKNVSWFRYLPATCSYSYEMAGVLTHEMGHVFGMDHVSESTSGNLTMSTEATPCSYADSSFGLGDYSNLADHYTA